MITVGMDVHVRNSYLHITDDARNVMRHGRCQNTLMDLAKFLGPIEREAVQRGEPVVRDRNQKHYSGGISHRGSNHLRAVLAEAAWMAVPRVPVYRHLFDRVEQKKNQATAIVAVARRMLEDAFTLLKRDEAFRYVATSSPRPSGGVRMDTLSAVR